MLNPRSVLISSLRLLALCGALFFLATPHWYYQLDDLFITLGYAQEWLHSGELRWTSGEVVEGYSNFLYLALLTGGSAFHLDGAMLARALSMGAGFGIVALFNALLPLDRRGTLTLLALVCWTSMSYWSMVALETTLFALLLGAGWMLVLRERGTWAAGVWLLALASLTRPEGSLYAGLGLLSRLRQRAPLRRSDLVAAGAMFALLLYHILRVAHFDRLWPTPFLVKVQAVSWGAIGLRELGGDLIAAGGLLGAVLAFWRLPKALLPWVALPLGVEALLLVRADGDWMGMGRLLFPGVVASSLAWVASGTPRNLRGSSWLAGAFIAACSLWESHWPADQGLKLRDFPALSHPGQNLEAELMIPFHEDLKWVIAHVPRGGQIEIADVGLIGNVPEVRVLDTVGLVDRKMAEYRASGAGRQGLDVLSRRYRPGPEQVECLRAISYRGEQPTPYDPASTTFFPVIRDVRYGAIWSRWYCRSSQGPSPELVRERWRELSRRYPSQEFINREYLKVLETTRSPEEVLQAVREAPGLKAQARELEARAGFKTKLEWQKGRGYALYFNQTLSSLEFTVGEVKLQTLVLDVDAPGLEGARARVSWRPGCGGPAEELQVMGRMSVPLKPPACLGTEQRVQLEVTFTNDSQGPAGDRNLYVSLLPSP